MKRLGKIHWYRGRDTDGGQSGLEIYDPPDGAPVMVLSELPWNTNSSVTNMIEILAAEIALEYFPKRERSRPPFHCIEHLYSWLGGDDRFELVTFAWSWPRGKKQSERPSLGEPGWRKIELGEVEALIGESYVECFRRGRQVAPPVPSTIEAVRLLRTHFSQLAKCHGPLAAALSRKDLPIMDSPESKGQLYVTSLDQWLFFPDGEIGVKLLSDETVAARWDLWELNRQLLLSVRQIAEIFLTHLELLHDHADFASALAGYFAHPEKLTVEIVESQAEHSKLWLAAHQQEIMPWELGEHRLCYGSREENHAQEA